MFYKEKIKKIEKTAEKERKKENKKAQLKIQQMSFLLLAVFFFFVLVGLFLVSVINAKIRGEARQTNLERAVEIASSVSSIPEFSCGSLCVDADKLIAFSSKNYEKEEFWKVSSIEVRKMLSDSETVVCTRQNYPDCNLFKIYETSKNETKVSSFVSLCRKEKLETGVYDRCELAKIIVGGYKIE